MTDNAQRIKMLTRRYAAFVRTGHLQKCKIRRISFEHYLVRIDLQGIYEGQTHLIELRTEYGTTDAAYQYPKNPPRVRFLTKLYHPNVSDHGSICVDFLTDDKLWSMTYGFDTVVTGITALLDNANCASPYNGKAARDWKEMPRDVFSQTARVYASDDVQAVLVAYCVALQEAANAQCAGGARVSIDANPSMFDNSDDEVLGLLGLIGVPAAPTPATSTPSAAPTPATPTAPAPAAPAPAAPSTAPTPAAAPTEANAPTAAKKRWQARVKPVDEPVKPSKPSNVKGLF
jgi:ubiquitin-protein ligase